MKDKKSTKDFQKKKAKAGKKTVRTNLTKINLKTKKIVIPSQARITKDADNQSERETLQNIIKQIHHYSEHHRIHGLQEVKSFLFNTPNPDNYLALLYPEMLELLFKEDHESRDGLIDAISSTIQIFKADSFIPILTVVITMVCSGLSNIDKSVRRDAAIILLTLIEKSPSMVQQYRQQILKHIVAIIQDKSLHFLHLSGSSGEAKSSSANSHHDNSTSTKASRSKSSKPSLLLICMQIIDKLLDSTVSSSMLMTSRNTKEAEVMVTLDQYKGSTNYSILLLRDKYNKEKLLNVNIDRNALQGTSGGIVSSQGFGILLAGGSNTASIKSASQSLDTNQLMELYTSIHIRLEEIWIQLTITDESLVSRPVVVILSHILRIVRAFIQQEDYWQYILSNTLQEEEKNVSTSYSGSMKGSTVMTVGKLLRLFSHMTQFFPYSSREVASAAPGSHQQIEGQYHIETFNFMISDIVYSFQHAFFTQQERLGVSLESLWKQSTTSGTTVTSSKHDSSVATIQLERIQEYQLTSLSKFVVYLSEKLMIADHQDMSGTVTNKRDIMLFSFEQIKDLILQILSIIPYFVEHCDHLQTLIQFLLPLQQLVTTYSETFLIKHTMDDDTSTSALPLPMLSNHFPIILTIIKIITETSLQCTNEPGFFLSSELYTMFVSMQSQCIGLLLTCSSFHGTSQTVFHLLDLLLTNTRQLLLTYTSIDTKEITNAMRDGMDALHCSLLLLLSTPKLSTTSASVKMSIRSAYDYHMLPYALKLRIMDVYALVPTETFRTFTSLFWKTLFDPTEIPLIETPTPMATSEESAKNRLQASTKQLTLSTFVQEIGYFLRILTSRWEDVSPEQVIDYVFDVFDQLIGLFMKRYLQAHTILLVNTENKAQDNILNTFGLWKHMISMFISKENNYEFTALCQVLVEFLFTYLSVYCHAEKITLSGMNTMVLSTIATWFTTPVTIDASFELYGKEKEYVQFGKRVILLLVASGMLCQLPVNTTIEASADCEMTVETNPLISTESDDIATNWKELSQETIRSLLLDLLPIYQALENRESTMLQHMNFVVDEHHIFVDYFHPIVAYAKTFVSIKQNFTTPECVFRQTFAQIVAIASDLSHEEKASTMPIVDETLQGLFCLRWYYLTFLHLPARFIQEIALRQEQLNTLQNWCKEYHRQQTEKCKSNSDQKRIIDNAMLDIFNLF